jgi:hypothetical protein
LKLFYLRKKNAGFFVKTRGDSAGMQNMAFDGRLW